MHLEVDIAEQSLRVFKNESLFKTYSISSAANGVGEVINSECTPRGEHIIRAKIGADSPVNAVFVGRRFTGEIYTPQMRAQFPNRDWILTRILWLSGTQQGKNRLGRVDTMRRYVYIHGTPDEVEMGQTGSRGCIRMRNQDLIELFDQVDVGTAINIIE
ncbi:MAG: L,D-transpeptidase [Arenicellales bacterium]